MVSAPVVWVLHCCVSAQSIFARVISWSKHMFSDQKVSVIFLHLQDWYFHKNISSLFLLGTEGETIPSLICVNFGPLTGPPPYWREPKGDIFFQKDPPAKPMETGRPINECGHWLYDLVAGAGTCHFGFCIVEFLLNQCSYHS